MCSVFALSATWSGAATIHVAASTGTGEGTASSPFGNIAAAVESASPGDTVLIRQGRYVINSPITISTPGIKLMGVSGERATIIADEKTGSVLNITASNVLVQDLVIRGGYYGIKIDVDDGDRPTHGVTIRNCAIGPTAADCMKIFNADALTIEACQIGPSGTVQKDNAEGIDIIGSIGVTIRSCVVEDVATNGIYFKGGTRDGVVERCLVRRAGHGGIILGQDTDEEFMRNKAKFEAIDCVARNNIVTDTQTAGLATYSGQNISLLNNTLVNVARTGQAGLWIVTNSREVPSEGVTIRNNVVAVGGDRPVMFFKDTGLPDSDYNVFYAPGEPRFVRELAADESMNRQWTFSQWQKSAGKDTHSRVSEPRLDEHHFRPLEGSPVIASGELLKNVTDDYFGEVREGKSDVGAVVARGASGRSQ